MQPLNADSLKDVFRGDRVRLVGNGVLETFQATCVIGRCQWFISLQFGIEYTRPQLCEKYMMAGCEFAIDKLPEHGWST